MNAPLTPRPNGTNLRSILSLLLVSAVAASAQTAPTAQTAPAPASNVTPTTSADSHGDEAIVLSPFEVSSTTDRGYQATSTLSGTWINTGYQDLAASISAVTKNMIEDLNVNNSEQLLTYTLGTEVSGPYGNYSGTTFGSSYDFDAIDRSLLPQVRIRGLSTADNTRNLFPTSVPWDQFDIDRVEIDRGPNAMLFGSGSPAGIVNNTTIEPEFDRNKGTLSLDYGRFGSSREQIDLNELLIPQKLAIRLAVKNSDDHFEQQEAFIKDKRIFLAGTYNVFKYTTIRGNVEYGSQESVKPEWRPPYDDGVTYWFTSGKPAYNPLTGQTTLTGSVAPGAVSALLPNGSANPNVISGFQTSWYRGPAFIFTSPNQYGSNIYNGATAVTNVAATGAGGGWASLETMAISANYERYALHAGQVGAGEWQPQELSDPSIFNFYDHMLEGANKPEGARWHVGNVSIEQDLPDRSGGVQLSYATENVQSSFNNPLNWATYGVTMDVNSYLLNGQANPNFGRPMIASDSWDTASVEKRATERAVLFYTFDSKKYLPEWLARIVGTHTITGTFNDSTDFNDTQGGRAQETGPDWYTSNTGLAGQPTLIANGGPRAFSYVVYLGNAGSSPTSLNIQPVGINIENPSVIAAGSTPITYYNLATNALSTSNVSVLTGSEFDKSAVNVDWTGGDTKTEIASHVVILHSDMLDDALLPTIGYRTDNFSAWNAPSDIVANNGYSEVKAPLPAAPSSTEEQHAFNWGGVVRLPTFLEQKMPDGLMPAFFYNHSDNFQPTAQRYDIFGAAIAPQEGQTKEWGFILGAFDGKLSVRLTHFDTAITGQSLDLRDALHSVIKYGIGGAWTNIINGANAGNQAAVTAFESWWKNDPLAKNIAQTYSFNVAFDSNGNPVSESDITRDGEVLQTTNTEAKGWETEITYNPLPNWRISASVDKESVITASTAQDALAFWNEIAPTLNGAAGQVYVTGGKETWQQSAQNFYDTVVSYAYNDGEPANPELRDWRVNLITNYNFTMDALKRFSVGGGLRWQSQILIGTGYKAGANGDIPDWSKQYWGPAEANYDGWASYHVPQIIKGIDWTLSINVRNLGVGKELVPAQANPDGSIAAWRIREPMTWTFRSEIKF